MSKSTTQIKAAVVREKGGPFEASFDVNKVLTTGKTIRGIVEGDSVPDLVIPSLVELYLQGRFPFDRLVKYYTLDQINQAAEDSEKGVTIKPIVRLGS